jgi:predicted RNA-binding protein associated with RNAse of E/G family
LENGYTAVSFIEYGKWYITEKIFDFDAVSTGFLVRLVTPVEENLTHLSTMDLFVKFWIGMENEYRPFGTKMFRKISEEGLFTETVEKEALKTADELVSRIKDGTFPPDFVKEFKIEREVL